MLHPLRPFIFWLNYWRYKLTWRHVKFRGYTIVLEMPDSEIKLGRGVINSRPESNPVGMSQRTIIIAQYGGKISIGDGFGISGSTIYSWASITIGKNVLIGANCKIIDHDFHPIDPEKRRLKLNREYTGRKAVIIGNDCFIGMSSIILKGSELGNNVIVGAGSVVKGKFPDNCIIAGNPAKIIKRLESDAEVSTN